MRTKGAHPPAGISELVGQSMSKSLGDANLQDKALGVGTPQNGEKVGKHNAVWAEVKLLSTTDLNNVEVGHALKDTPVACTLVSWSNAATPDVFFLSRPILQEKWTRTTCRVAVIQTGGAGSVDGTVLRFRVEGA